MAYKLGIPRSDHLPESPSVILGAGGVSPLDMTHAYATIAAMGVRRPLLAVTKVAPYGQKPILTPASKNKGHRVMQDGAPWELTKFLDVNVHSCCTGTNANVAALGPPVPGAGGQDRHHRQPHRRLVLRLHPQPGRLCLGRLPAGRGARCSTWAGRSRGRRSAAGIRPRSGASSPPRRSPTSRPSSRRRRGRSRRCTRSSSSRSRRSSTSRAAEDQEEGRKVGLHRDRLDGHGHRHRHGHDGHRHDGHPATPDEHRASTPTDNVEPCAKRGQTPFGARCRVASGRGPRSRPTAHRGPGHAAARRGPAPDPRAHAGARGRAGARSRPTWPDACWPPTSRPVSACRRLPPRPWTAMPSAPPT